MIASIIILNYKKEDLTIACVKSVLSNDYPMENYEIIIVDNASTQASYNSFENEFGRYPNLKILGCEENLGFSGGCNKGISYSKGKYIILLNNDTLVPKDWLSKMVEYAETRDAGIIGTKILFARDKNVINNAGSYMTDKGDAGDIGFREEEIGQYDYEREVFAVCGGNMLIKRAVIEKIGPLDDKFFAYYEDTDLCYRARLCGYKILYIPNPAILHYHAATSGEWSPLFTFYVLRNKLFLHIKNSNLKLLLKTLREYLKQVIYSLIIMKVGVKLHIKIIFSIIKNLPQLIFDRLRIRFFIKKISDSSIYNFLEKIPGKKRNFKKVSSIIIYNRYLDTSGGGELSTIFLAKGLSDIFPNANIDIVTFDKDIDKYGPNKIKSKSDMEKVFNIKLNDRVCIKRFRSKMQPILETLKPDSKIYPLYLKAHLILLGFKLKNIASRSDLFINHTFMDEFAPKANVSMYSCMFPHRTKNKNFIAKYNKVISISEFTLGHVNQRWGCKSDLLYPYAIEEIPDYNDFKNRENIIVSVGRFFKEGHNKRHDIIIRAFNELKDKGLRGWKLILIGRCAEKDKEYLRELQELSGDSEVIFLTNTSEAEKNSILDKSKIYVHATGFDLSENDFPECMEHFGISVVEAKLHGTVPIVINKGGMKELVKDGIDGFRFDDMEGLIDKLYSCASNQDKLKDLSLNAYDNALNKFSYVKYKEFLRLIMKNNFKFD